MVYENLSDSYSIERLLKDTNLFKKTNINLDFFKNFNKGKVNIKFDNYIYEDAIKI